VKPGTPSGSDSAPGRSAPALRRLLKRHRFVLALRVIAIAATAAAAGGLAVGESWVLSVLGAGLVTVQGVALLRYTERTPREVLSFLEALRYDDLSVRVSGADRGPLFAAVAEGFAEVSEAFRRLRSEREEQSQVLQTVVRHVGVALLTFKSDGEVALFNTEAKRLLGVPGLRRVEHLARWSPPLAEALGRLRAGERALVRVEREDRVLDLAVYAAQFSLSGEPYTLVSLHDIRRELEEKEMEAWQQLTRVLTHEIANSVTPIASLAATAIERLAGGAEATSGDVREALTTIERRSRGLVRFVETYKSFTQVPQPSFALIRVDELFEGVRMLLATSLRGHGISLEVEVKPPELELMVDPELIEQVLLNLLLNAIEALAGRPGARVRLRSRLGDSGRPVIEVIDNGPGIEPEALEQVFVPFFTTKAKGGGIGLSLSRQILRLHGGALNVRSEPGVETAFTLRF